MNKWRVAFASAIGSSHTKLGTECQDYCLATIINCRNQEVLLGCIADGAGSASRSAEGSRIACEAFIEIGAEYLLSGRDIASLDKRTVCDYWLERIRQRIICRAEEECCPVRDFATTLLAVLLSNSFSAYIQVGDGAIVTNDSGNSEDYTVVFWPQHGEYANTTNFLTDNSALVEAEFQPVPTVAYRIAIFSDGLERVLLDMKNQVAATKAIEQLIQPLLRESGVDDLNISLQTWLQTKAVNDRTDDDKSLILAVRLR